MQMYFRLLLICNLVKYNRNSQGTYNHLDLFSYF